MRTGCGRFFYAGRSAGSSGETLKVDADFYVDGMYPILYTRKSYEADLYDGAMMKAVKLRKWDSAEHLKTAEDMAAYLEACLQEAGDDAAFIAKALVNIARAKGMSQLASETGMGRESLYKALSGEGNPSFATILKVTRALGIELHAQPVAA